MKNFFKKSVPIIIIVLMLVTLIPGISARIINENRNDNVTVSILYNDLRNTVSTPKLNQMLNKYKSIGIDTVSVMEDDLNSLIVRGDVYSTRYHALRYDPSDDMKAIVNAINESCKKIENFSHVVIVTEKSVKERLKNWFPKKFTGDEYSYFEDIDGKDVYVLYDASKEMWDYALGYNEKEIKDLHSKGFNIALVFKPKNYKKTDYLSDLERIIKTYNVEYLNLKEDFRTIGDKKTNDKNYTAIADMINKNNMTLVVTENTNQLSNQNVFGYEYIFNKVMSENGSNKVVRSYESYDNTHYTQRTEQLFNSTVDRNIRFITTTTVIPPSTTYEEAADYTFDCMEEYINRIKAEGFTVNSQTEKFDYNANKRLNSAACAVIMVMVLLIMIEILTGKKNGILTLVAVILSAIAFAVTFILPESLVSLYPTVYCVMLSCFTMTIVLHFIKLYKDKFNLALLTLCSVVILVAMLLVGSIGLGTMLSGIGYYINNEIFVGIKLTLLLPVAYTTIIYYFMFIKNSGVSITDDIKKVLFAEIKVYWIILAGIIGFIGMYYITRSGNVSSISSIEQALRNTVTEIFPARPRTKEFLIGYPSLILLIYYIKKTDIKLIQWAFAAGLSILAASITNSFCHVFTDYTFIVSRVINGLLVGIMVSAIVFVINHTLVEFVKYFIKRFVKES